jgi:uncharacterized FlgJ-related protein
MCKVQIKKGEGDREKIPATYATQLAQLSIGVPASIKVACDNAASAWVLSHFAKKAVSKFSLWSAACLQNMMLHSSS